MIKAPRVGGFVDLGDRAGLKYSYAAMGQAQVGTLQSLFAAGTLAACLLVSAGTTPEAAIAAVRAACGPRAVWSIAQADFVVMFAPATSAVR